MKRNYRKNPTGELLVGLLLGGVAGAVGYAVYQNSQASPAINPTTGLPSTNPTTSAQSQALQQQQYQNSLGQGTTGTTTPQGGVS
jgi:predicted negative regulator of RcsB-dependent stress response